MRTSVPVLGIAGLSLSLAGGASASVGGLGTDLLTQNAGPIHEIVLADEEISDVSLRTFHAFDKENTGRESTLPVRLAFSAGGCGCGGCAGWTGSNYTASLIGPNPPQHSRHVPKRAQLPKNQ
jgi:hypothetical protein